MNGEDLISRPEDVRLQYTDGTTEPIAALMYVGQEGDLFVWEGIDPHPDRTVFGMTVGILPAHTTVTLRR
jgi:hypothetical protein